MFESVNLMSRRIKEKTNDSTEQWDGACIDTGAKTTVFGLKQARAYSSFMEARLETEES